jgi:hypothetical protein
MGREHFSCWRAADSPLRCSTNPQYNFADEAGLPKWSIKLNFSLLVPST